MWVKVISDMDKFGKNKWMFDILLSKFILKRLL